MPDLGNQDRKFCIRKTTGVPYGGCAVQKSASKRFTSRFSSLNKHDLFGKPLHTFPDHALGNFRQRLPLDLGIKFRAHQHDDG
jgi:hypothetical protein